MATHAGTRYVGRTDIQSPANFGGTPLPSRIGSMRFSLSIIILSMICAGAAQAQKPPIPAKKNDSVQAIERQLEAEKSEQKELEQKISSIKGFKIKLKYIFKY